MESLPREELERLMFFEQAREQAEVDWTVNPRDAQVRGPFARCGRYGPAARPARCDARRREAWRSAWRCCTGFTDATGGCARGCTRCAGSRQLCEP
jgi:hypothetical protein